MLYSHGKLAIQPTLFYLMKVPFFSNNLMLTKTSSLILFYLLALSNASAYAEKTEAEVANEILSAANSFPKITSLNWLNEKFLTKQRDTIEEITRTRYGRSLTQTKGDLKLLQRIINDAVIKPDETERLQALGVVLGDAYVNEEAVFEWKIYTDELGATHAVCVRDTTECIFVITMLSRRMEVGLKPDVNRIYEKGINSMKKFLPKLPYAVE